MNGIFSATVCLTSSKSCFMTLSGDLAQRFASSAQDPVKVIIFKVEWQGGVVFVSWSGDVTVNRSVGLGQTQSSVVEIGRKFAELNGIQNSEQILLTRVDRASTPSCTRIHVDPFSPDDWEILELHAGFIESNLLNQVRVVWKGQVLPIWINKTTCIVINIGETEPDAACVVLEEFTEVIISPKQRNFVSSKKSEIPTTTLKKEQEKISHLHHARENDFLKSQEKVAESSLLGGNVAMNPCTQNEGSKEGFSPTFLNWWNYFLHGEQEESNEPLQGDFTNRNQNVNMEDKNDENSFDESMKRSCCVAAFERVELDLCLRNQMDVGILQRSNNQEECRKKVGQNLEPFAVFVHPSTVGFNKLKCGKNHSIVYPDDYEGLKKVVIIRRVLSPKERVELFNISKRKSSKENETSLGNQGKKDVVTKQENSFSGAVVKMVLTKNVLPGHIAMHSHMQKQLGSLGMSRFLVNDVTYQPQDIQGIILHPVRDALNKIEDLGHEVVLGSFIDWVSQTSSEKCPLILWDEATVAFDCLGRSVKVIVTMLSHIQSKVNPESVPYYNITPSTLEKIKVVVGEAKSTPKPIADLLQVQTENKTQLCCSINDLGGFDEPFHKCLKHLSVSLQQDPLSTLLSGGLSAGLANGAVLICGSGAHVGEGCGKTSLAHAVCQQLQQWPICAHVTIIDCIPLRAKRVETIQRHWQQAFLEAAWHQPSVILLDNLDHVISAPSLAQEMGGEGFYRKRLVEVFKDLIATEVANNTSVAVIATSRSRNSLHTALQSGRGSHVFQCCVELGALNEKQRIEILSIMIKRKFQEAQQTELDTVLINVVKKSEGFSPKDLSRLTERAVHFSVVRKMNETKGSSHPSFILDDFNQALSGFIPASLQGVQLHKAGDLSWADIGGLHDVRDALKETLLWPSKYRKIFSKCPLRLRSGLLLYGPPGTGKTLLAGVVAKESGLNFISIKGPELLSKFIGASEQAVRDVFTRAQTAKPCILFFDEFDSLAPRRGHDSTGVTDRVVNQLLTELDGVEGLEGVYILAATSRPGLIDPALLRPGRLDKCVYCPIPNKSERLEILLALTRHLPLADNIDLKSIADKCDNFTGADLKALLYNAQLESIHRSTSKLQLYGNIFDTKDEIKQLEKTRENMTQAERHSSQIQENVYSFSIGGGMKVLSSEEAIENEEELVDVKQKPEKKENVIYISQSDLNKAASTIRPSVSPKERLVYENIFDSFIKSRGGSFTKNLPMEEKATLA